MVTNAINMKVLLLLLTTILLTTTLHARDEIVSIKLSSQNGLPDNSVRYMQQAPSGQLLLMMRYAAYSYDGYSYRRLPQADFERLKEASLRDHSLDKEHDRDNLGNHVVMDGNALLYTDAKTGEQIRLNVLASGWEKLTNNLKCRVVTDREGRIWVSLNGDGLYVYNRQTRQLRHISEDDGSGLIDTDYLVYMTIDRDGRIWIAEHHYGLVCLQTVNQGYEVVMPPTDTKKERATEIRMMSRLADGRIVLSNNAGVVMQADSMLQHIVPLPSDGENYISASLDANGRLWLGSRVNGVCVDGRHYGEGRIDCILRDRSGRMWICGLNRPVAQVALDGDGRFSEQTFFTDIDKLQARMMVEDHRGDIWLATEKGLYVFRPDELLRNPKAYTQVCPEPVRCLFEDSRHMLWAGTLVSGVLMGDNAKTRPATFSRLDRNGGLAGDVIQMIGEDGRHCICIATQTGCSVYRVETGRARTLFITDHQLRNYYEENSQALLADGRLAMGTLDGIVVLESDAISVAKSAHGIAVTSIYVNGEEMASVDQLKHNQNTLTFYVSNFNFPELQQTDYSFLLEGYDRDWSAPSPLNQTSYRNLPPGRYTLHVKAREAGGQWGPESLTQVVISPPLWATWWAYLIYIVVAVVVAYTLYRHLRHLNALNQAVAVEKQLTEYKLKFFTNISHEFRTPLTLIQGSMDKLHQLPETPASARQPLSSMQRNVDRLLRLINQLLEFRRMQNNKLQLSLEETDVVSFVYNICQTFHDTAEQQKIALSFVPSMKSYTMFLDRGFVDKAVYNLLSNAFKYTPKGGSVTVKIRSLGVQEFRSVDNRPDDNNSANELSSKLLNSSTPKLLRIEVTDTGVGVPEDQREKIFDRFQRGQIGRDSLGIGLDLTAELIRTHHGTIRCEANPAGGSIFTITLPTDKSVYNERDFLSDKAPRREEQTDERRGFTEAVHETQVEPMNDHRVLIVEDDAEIRSYLQHELGRYFTVETASDGEEALEKIENGKMKMENAPADEHLQPSIFNFQLIISDVLMPRMNGYELLRRLRQNAKTRHLPVIMLTALDAEDQQLKGLDAGADAYITKPFSLQLLLLQCRNLLQRGDRMKDAFAKTEKPSKQLAPEIITEERDHKLLAQLAMWVDSHLASPELSVDKFAEDMGYGRTTFYTKLKALTGQTPNEYIKERRLQRAAELLKDDHVTVSEVAYQVGMGTPQYLSTIFKKRFGITPSQYQKGK